MSKINQLEQRVHELYDTPHPNRADWTDWLAANHVWVVADHATVLANRFDANPDLARAAALLHDIADVRMSRFADNHKTASWDIAREELQRAGFSSEDIKTVVDDALPLHNCRHGQIPDTLVGKVLATADAMAHLTSDFYIYATWAKSKRNEPLDEVKAWVRGKIHRDYHEKTLFREVQNELKPDYEALKRVFDR